MELAVHHRGLARLSSEGLLYSCHFQNVSTGLRMKLHFSPWGFGKERKWWAWVDLSGSVLPRSRHYLLASSLRLEEPPAELKSLPFGW